MILYYKYFIYVQRCLGTSLSTKSLQAFIDKYIEIERSIAQQSDKLNLHIAKWGFIEETVSV